MFVKIKLPLSRKGSVLVFSLIILSFMLISALSVATVSVSERRSSLSTEQSSRSFQVADSGVEIMLQKIYKGSATDLKTLAATLVGGSCSSGVISGSTNSGKYNIYFYDSATPPVQITGCTDTTWRTKAASIKSVGIAGNTTRAVEVEIAPAG